jgi:dynein heavy chain
VFYRCFQKFFEKHSLTLIKKIYEAFFIFAAIWNIGGDVEGGQDNEKDFKDFNNMWRSNAKIKFPEGGLSYDYFFEITESKGMNCVQCWHVNLVENSFISRDIRGNSCFPKRLRLIVDIHLKRRMHFLYIGGAGTGKTAVIKDFLS